VTTLPLPSPWKRWHRECTSSFGGHCRKHKYRRTSSWWGASL